MMKRIPFNVPLVLGNEGDYIKEAIDNKRLSGDGPFTKLCEEWIEKEFNCKKVLLTPSCTDALEMMGILADISPEDEVILPSYTFVSTANAFLLRGAKIIFVDVRPDTMNMDETVLKKAITKKTKAIVPVHYGGVSCDMDAISNLALENNIMVFEDAAQGMMSTYNGKPLGTMGDLGTFSFHETKNYTCGEGGALLINNQSMIERAEIIREKGTNRSSFFRGEIDKYTWVDIGSSYLMSDLSAAYLYPQLLASKKVNIERLRIWDRYYEGLKPLKERGVLQLPVIPDGISHNAHMFYCKTESFKLRSSLISHLKNENIMAIFHYVPLHSSKAGQKYGYLSGSDQYTTEHSERLLRLPLYYGLKDEEIDRVIDSVVRFFVNI
jgi:dTDP-4-amino-4,6-dideoxygalactose transaminase